MPQLTIRLFGSFQVAIDRQPVQQFRSNKVRGLLAYLLSRGGEPVSRRYAAELLWDGYTISAAQTNLRQSLTNLRHALAPFDLLDASYRTICLKTDHPRLWCDMLVWQQMLQNPEVEPKRLWTLAPLVIDGFLASLPVIDSKPFQTWRITQNAIYQRQATQLRYPTLGVEMGENGKKEQKSYFC